MARKAVQAVALSVLAAAALTLTGQPADHPPYQNPDLPADKRAADLVSRMTLEEKVAQMQNNAPAIPKLGVPVYGWWNEALHGVARAGEATVFPQAIGLAATWDTDLEQRIGDIIATEARAKYNDAIKRDSFTRQYSGLTFWSPNINIFRDPRWGRGQETFGEDPFLTGRIGVAFIKGMQGNDPHYFKVIATAKHYAVHSGPESTRHKADVHPSERDLNDTYLPAFKAAVMEGHVDSIMCAYNAIDGFPACANTQLLQTYLKSWGFNGYVVSDCGAISDFYSTNGHKYSPTAPEADAIAVKAGTDLTCGTEYLGNGRGGAQQPGLVDAVKNGLIKESEIDQAVIRLFTARFKLGMFDPPERVPFNKITLAENDSPAHRQVALEAARKSIVLLKNDNQTLPLKASVKKIAVIGPSADDPGGAARQLQRIFAEAGGAARRHRTPVRRQGGNPLLHGQPVCARYAGRGAVDRAEPAQRLGPRAAGRILRQSRSFRLAQAVAGGTAHLRTRSGRSGGGRGDSRARTACRSSGGYRTGRPRAGRVHASGSDCFGAMVRHDEAYGKWRLPDCRGQRRVRRQRHAHFCGRQGTGGSRRRSRCSRCRARRPRRCAGPACATGRGPLL